MPEVQSEAHITIVFGEPGAGKSTTGVKKLIDTHKKFPDARIFANTHLFGLKYMFLPLPKLIEYFNTTINGLPIDHPDAIPLIGHGIYLYDEGSQGANARQSNSADTLVIQNLITQARKRHFREIIFVAQDVRLLTWEIKKLCNEWIECKRPYPKSNILSRRDLITLTVKKNGRPSITFDYHGSSTWKYFKSDQLHPVSDSRLARALERSRIASSVANKVVDYKNVSLEKAMERAKS